MADQRYSGVLLVLPDGQVLLQRRDDDPRIVNPGRVTLFGGLAEGGEDARECAVRELGEELGLVVAPAELAYLAGTVKEEDSGALTECSLYVLHLEPDVELVQREGAGICRAGAAAALADPRLSEVARFGIAAFTVRRSRK